MQSIFFHDIMYYKVGVYMQNTFTMITKDGIEKEYEILANFKMESNNKSYLVYTDNTYSDGKLNIYAKFIVPESETLNDVETDEEWELIEKILNKNYIRE